MVKVIVLAVILFAVILVVLAARSKAKGGKVPGASSDSGFLSNSYPGGAGDSQHHGHGHHHGDSGHGGFDGGGGHGGDGGSSH